MVARKYLVTGGTGFLGSALVKGLLHSGYRVRSLDNNSRGSLERLGQYAADVEIVEGDIRDLETVSRAVQGVDCVCHLAYVNGTRFFYEKPGLVLEVGVKGIMNVLDACLKADVGDLVVASSSEVYQTPPTVPTSEDVPLVVPDPLNPRYSYGGGKIISELLALNYGRTLFQRTVIFRPHNVYGPNMGWEHVVPEFVLRMRAMAQQQPSGLIRFPIQGSGQETRSFVYIDDFTDGLLRVIEQGKNLNIYNIGTREELTIAEVAHHIGRYLGREVEVAPGKLQPGSTVRRCPDITKIQALGYSPRYTFAEGLVPTALWYEENASRQPSTENATISAEF